MYFKWTFVIIFFYFFSNLFATFLSSFYINTRLLGHFAPIFYFNCEHFLFVHIVKKKFADLKKMEIKFCWRLIF